MTRSHAISTGLALLAACAGTLWKVDTTFNVVATTEAAQIEVDSTASLLIPIERGRVFRGFSDAGSTITGTVDISPGSTVAFERVSTGPLRLLVTSPEPMGSVVLDSADAPAGPPQSRMVIRIDSAQRLAAAGRTLVLPFRGRLRLGSELDQASRGHAILRSAVVKYLGHTLFGQRLYDAGHSDLDPGDVLVIDSRSPGSGFLVVDERPGMLVLYRVRGKEGRVQRFGAQGYEIAISLRARLLNDPVVIGLWATFGAVLTLYGKAFARPRTTVAGGSG